MTKPLILVDGSSYLFRAYHALPPTLTNDDGHPTNAMLGVLNMLRRLLKDYEPKHCVVVFDSKGKNFRHELYPDYKANRIAMPEDLAVQIEPLHEMIQLMGFPLIKQSGVEADDIIGTLTHQALEHGQSVLISTGDKDMTQLIHAHVHIVDTMKGTTMDGAYVKQKFGVNPEQMIDFLALVGDSSDNIPGVPKVGPKTAAKWLSEYSTLDNLKAHADEIGGKVGEYLRDNLDQLDLSKKLVTIDCKLGMSLPLESMAMQPADESRLRKALKQWGFKSWLKEMESEAAKPIKPKDYTCILTRQTWQQWHDKIKAATLVAVDTETTSLDAMQAKLVGISFATAAGEAAYLPLQHDYLDVPQQLNNEQTWQELKALLENPNIKKVGQHLKYDIKVLARAGIQLQGVVFDTLLASYILNPSSERHGLDSMAQKYLSHQMVKYEDITGKGAKQICFSQVDLDTASHYSAEDADITLQIYHILKQKLLATPQLYKLFETEEMPCMHVLTQMELYGVLIDAKVLQQQSHDLAIQIDKLEQQAYSEAGQPFNLSSPKQLQEILYEKHQIPVIKKTPKGQPSTAESVLQELALSYKLPKLILEYRHLSKLKSTYIDKLPRMILPDTGRVHTRYHQHITSTGRLSSSDPNLQNIPIRTETGRRIRDAFIAPSDHVIMAADYSQVELRIMAHLSQDPSLIQAFKDRADIHTRTASEVFGVVEANVTSELRRRAKAINFGLIYGMSAFGLAKQLGVGREQAQQYINTYFDRYPGVARYMDETRELAKQQGYVETLFGRRLYLPDIQSHNGMLRQAAERAAINAPMQGSAADIIKCAMIDIQRWLELENLPIHMIMQVHDELVFEVPQNLIDQARPAIQQHMMQAGRLDVPLIVDIGVGDNWNAAH